MVDQMRSIYISYAKIAIGAENCSGDPGGWVNQSTDKGKFLHAKIPHER